MITKTCEICGSFFQVRPYRAVTARFCSRACGGKWHMAHRKMPNDHKVGNTWRKGLRPSNAFTSDQARTMSLVAGEQHECALCRSRFEIKPWLARQNKTKSGKRFCSKRCHGLYKKIQESGTNAPDYVGGITTYRGKGWPEARAAAVSRDKGVCQECGIAVGASIPVHHIRPYRLFETSEQANAIENLVCLCQSCHMRVERALA